MENIVTIQEEFILPSKGLIYREKFDPHIRMRSMTVAEEMKRLSPATNPYKMMSEIIDACIIDKLPISAYDMCLGDYVYLLQKLRTVTYGAEYKIGFTCPFCKTTQETTLDLDKLKVHEYDESIKDMYDIVLPRTQHKVRLKFQTPRDLDYIAARADDLKKKFKEMADPTVLLTLESFIETIDGEPLNKALSMELLKSLPAMDYNVLQHKATQLNERIGIDVTATVLCSECGSEVNTVFRYTSEFFRPAVD